VLITFNVCTTDSIITWFIAVDFATQPAYRKRSHIGAVGLLQTKLIWLREEILIFFITIYLSTPDYL